MSEEITVPIMFDHTAETTAVSDPDSNPPRYLIQNGHKFTFAKMDKIQGRWLPEPKLIEDFDEKRSNKNITDLLLIINQHLSKIVNILPALEIYGREAMAKQQIKDKSFNKLKGELGVMKRELAKLEKLKKLATVKRELAKLEKDVDGE